MYNEGHNKFIVINGKIIDTTNPIVMSIINITPDSFYSGSRKQEEESIIESTNRALYEGATILDIGGYSTRPGATFVSEEEEIERISKALKAIRREHSDAIISVDTFRGKVAEVAVKEYGVNIINDISGYELDPKMLSTIIDLQVPYILMHNKGNPQTMQNLTTYNSFLPDILQYFAKKIDYLRTNGFNKEIIIDPGYGFAKSVEQNYSLLVQLPLFETFGAPLLVGISRKSMIYKPLGIEASDALNGTTALNCFALERGANILRVHDTREAIETIKLYNLLHNIKK